MIDLKSFCATEELDPFRPYLHTPFSLGEYSYATDGRVIVRVPLRHDIGPAAKINGFPETVLKTFETHTRINLMPLVLPAKFASLPKTECEKCDGRGKEHDCQDCDCQCTACDGTGMSEGKVSCGLFGVAVDLKFIRKIASLPSPEITRPENSNDPIYFRFDGGDGFVMPLRSPSNYHIDLLVEIAQ